MSTHPFTLRLPLLTLAVLAFQALSMARAEEPAARFSSASKGNIFTAASGEVILGIAGSDAVTGGAVLLKDEQGRETGRQNIAPGENRIAVALPQKGYYQLSAEVGLASGKTLRAAATAAVVGPLLEDSVRNQSRLGLWTVQGDRDLVLAAGARWNRAMATIRDLPEDFARTGSAPALQSRPPFDISGFTYEGVLSFGLPLWLVDAEPGAHKGSSNPFQAPKSWEALTELVKAYTRRPPRWSEFPPYLEIYNEPEWHWKGTNEDLVRYQKTVADAVKAERPDVKVLGPGFSSIRIKDAARIDLETVHRLGLLEHLDGLVLHAYVDGSAPEELFIQRVQELQAFLARIGRPDFPIHLTEFGWCTKPGTWQRPVDELTQARYVTRSLTLLAALGVENATYFALLFKAAPNEGERSFSIVHDNQTPKPAFAAYANVARWLADVRGKGRWFHLTPTTHLVAFEKAQSAIAVAWDTAGSRSVPLAGAFTRAAEMSGKPLPALAPEAPVEISPSPVFLELKNSGLYQAKELPAVRLMRGTAAELPSPAGGAWITPEPLTVKGRAVSAPRDARQGAYLLLSHADAQWTALPVEVIAPVQISAPRVVWPITEPAPRITAEVTSHSGAPLSVLANAKFDNVRRMFGAPAKIAPAGAMEIAIPVDDFSLGRRYKGTLTVESRENGERDQIQQPLDFTVLAAQRVAPGQAPAWKAIPAIDFSAWDPFGEPSAKEDCSATFQAAYDARALYLRIRVRDDQHLQTRTAEHIFNQDSLQIGLDADAEKTWEANDLFGLKGHRVFEYGAAWDGAKAMNWRWISYTPELPPGVSEPRMGTAIRREGDITEYLLTFPWEILGLKEAPRAGTAIGIALAVADSDPGKSGRCGLRLFNGITDEKDPQKYGKLWLR